jgi:hypothetical protein
MGSVPFPFVKFDFDYANVTQTTPKWQQQQQHASGICRFFHCSAQSTAHTKSEREEFKNHHDDDSASGIRLKPNRMDGE